MQHIILDPIALMMPTVAASKDEVESFFIGLEQLALLDADLKDQLWWISPECRDVLENEKLIPISEMQLRELQAQHALETYSVKTILAAVSRRYNFLTTASLPEPDSGQSVALQAEYATSQVQPDLILARIRNEKVRSAFSNMLSEMAFKGFNLEITIKEYRTARVFTHRFASTSDPCLYIVVKYLVLNIETGEENSTETQNAEFPAFWRCDDLVQEVLKPLQIPLLRTRECCSALERAGFEYMRTTGSHKIYRKNGRSVSVPGHSDHAEIPRGTMESIINQTGLSPAEFIGYLQ